jgi:hypothetical protein
MCCGVVLSAVADDDGDDLLNDDGVEPNDLGEEEMDGVFVEVVVVVVVA